MARAVDLNVRVGEVELANPVMTASGTSGYATELASYGDLAALGAVVVKSLCPGPWPGNPAPRLHASEVGMVNSIGLQGPGVEAWRRDHLPGLEAVGATVVASVWGHTVEEYATACEALADAGPAVVAIEVNLSCPNLEGHGQFAHSADDTARVVGACEVGGRPTWAKLTAAVPDVAAIAAAAAEAGASAVTLVNTLPALEVIRGGLSGAALHPVAVRAVYDTHKALPDLPIVGVGGVSRAADAVDLLRAGAKAIQVGTATFADPHAPFRLVRGLERWCRRHDVRAVGDLSGELHG